MTISDIMKQLEAKGTEQARRIYTNHGADLDMYGVSMKDLKLIAKKIPKNHSLGMELLQSNHIDAMYLSQWIIDSNNVTIQQLETVLKQTDYYMIIENVVSTIAAKNTSLAKECISKWIDSSSHRQRQAAYTIYSLLISSIPNEQLDFEHISQRLDHIKAKIHLEQNRVRYAMNNFVIHVGGYLQELHDKALATSNEIGIVSVSMGKTACKVPYAPDYISKMKQRNMIGTKRKI